MEKKYSMVMLKPMEYNNTYALAMPKKIADQKNISTISDLGNIAQDAKVGFTLEFADREDGYKGMQKYITISSRMLKRWNRNYVTVQFNQGMLM